MVVPKEGEIMWTVYRQDDNGQVFVVEENMQITEADDLIEFFEKRGHKQLFYKEEQPFLG